ncbi:MAG: NAD-dependent epimerase/dehydratase family protein [Bacteroidota bacterium]
MNILVTGGTGFIGSHVVEELLAHGHHLRVMAHSGNLGTDLQFIQKHTEFVLGDISDRSTIRDAVKDMDAIIHLAWSTVPKNATADPTFDVQSNVIGSLYLLEEARDQQVQKFVFISSGGTVYGKPTHTPIPETHPTNPISAYGLSKLTVEKYLQLYHHLYNLDYSVLRVANAYGERQNLLKGQGVVGVWLYKALRRESLEVWGDGSVARDYVYVKDVAKAAVLAVEKESRVKTFNVGSGNAISLNEVLKAIKEITKRDIKVNYTPGREFDVPTNELDISLIHNNLGWQPEMPFQQGLARVWQYLQGEQQ